MATSLTLENDSSLAQGYLKVNGSTAATLTTSGITGNLTGNVTGNLTGSLTAGGSLTLATAQTATGTSVDFTGIPSWAKRITVMFNGVSTSGTTNILIQLGVSGTPETSGYTSVGNVVTAAGVSQVTSIAGFIIYAGTDSYSQNGAFRLNNIASNTWVADGVLCNTTTQSYTAFIAGSKALAGTLNMIRITNTGSDTFDAGTINISYEG